MNDNNIGGIQGAFYTDNPSSRMRRHEIGDLTMMSGCLLLKARLDGDWLVWVLRLPGRLVLTSPDSALRNTYYFGICLFIYPILAYDASVQYLETVLTVESKFREPEGTWPHA